MKVMLAATRRSTFTRTAAAVASDALPSRMLHSFPPTPEN